MQFLELAAAHMLRLCRYDVKNDKVMHTRLINCRVLVLLTGSQLGLKENSLCVMVMVPTQTESHLSD